MSCRTWPGFYPIHVESSGGADQPGRPRWPWTECSGGSGRPLIRLDDRSVFCHTGCMSAVALNALATIYDELDAAIEEWRLLSWMACPSGCGLCCAEYVPELHTIESDFLALYIERHNPRLAELFGIEGAGCPFYRPDEPLHCPVYPARPLICRAFAFSSVRADRGQPLFRPCGRMPSSTAFAAAAYPARSAFSRRLRDGLGCEPPVMDDYAMKIAALAPQSARSRIGPALRASCIRLGLGRAGAGHSDP